MEQNVKGKRVDISLPRNAISLLSRNTVRAFILSLCFFCSKQVLGQTAPLDNNQLTQRVQKGILKNFRPDSVLLSKFCGTSCIFIRFSADVNGHMKYIAFSKDSISFIQAALAVAVKSLESDLILMNALKQSGKTIIQPFIYEYQAGCDLGRNHSSFGSATKMGSRANKGSEAEILFAANHTNRALLNMLNFNSMPLTEIDCLLLTPIQVSSGVMY